MSRPQVTKEKVLSAIDRLSGLDKQNADTWGGVRTLLNGITDDDDIAMTLSMLSAGLDTKIEANKEIARAVQAVAIVLSGITQSVTNIDKNLEDLIRNNHVIGKIELKIDEATTHGRATNQLKRLGVDVDSEQDETGIAKIKGFFQKNGEEILKLFATATIAPKELHEHITQHLQNAFDAFQKIEGPSVSSETVKDLIETLANVGEAAKAAVGLGNDFSKKKSKEDLLKKIKEKLPDTSDELLVTATAAAFNTTEQVVRFEQAQKAEAEKIIAAAKARAAGKMGSISTEGARTYSPKSEEDVEALITKNRAAAKKSLEQGNLGDAVKNFELARNARNGVVLEYKTVDGVEILIRGAENRRQKPEGIENLESEYLTLVMAAIDIAEVEGKTSLKARLLERATNFLEKFLEKAESLDVIAAAFPKKEAIGVQKSLSKMLDEEIKNYLVKSLRDAGISNASDKLIVAHDFQSLANRYPHIVSIDGRGAIKHEPSRTTLLSATEKGNLDGIFTADKKPIAFSNLPWWHQDLMQKYAPAILASTAPLPASVVSVLGIENARPVEQTQRLQMSKPPHPFLTKIASLPWVQKTFPEFAEKINERTKQWQTDDDAKHSDRREKEGDFRDAYSAAKKEITSSKRTMDAAGSAPGVPTVTEVIAETSVSPPASVASVSGLAEKEADLLEKQAKETRNKMYTDAGFSEEEIDEFENDLFPPPEKDAPAVPAEHVATHSSAVASEIVEELGEVEKSLKAAAKDDVSTPTVETPHHGTKPEPRTSSALSGAEPNEARDTAPSPVADTDNAREEAATLLAKLGSDALNAIKGAMDTTHGIAEVTSGAVVSRVEELEAKIAAQKTSDEHESSNRER